MQFDLLIRGATIVTGDAAGTVVPDGVLGIVGDTIAWLGPRAELPPEVTAGRTLDGRGQYLFPGLINTHTHLYQTLLKGIGDDLPLVPWLDVIVFPTVPALTEQITYVAALLGALESIRSGCTTVLDYSVHHPDPGVYEGPLRAFRESGLRGLLGRGLRDHVNNPLDSTPLIPLSESLDHCRSLADRLDPDRSERRIWLAPGATWIMTPAGLDAVRACADDQRLGITLHMHEVDYDCDVSLERFGQRTLPFLAERGFLGPDLVCAHCVKLDETDCALMARHDVKMSYNPVSNMYLASGIPPLPRLLELGVTCGLATDGAASNNSQDMIEALKFGALLPKVATLDAAVVTAPRIFQCATRDAAKALGMETMIGALAVGMQADCFLFEPRHPKSIPVHDPISTLVYSASEANVHTTVIDGQIVMEAGRILTVDEPAILAEAQALATDLVRRVGTARR